MLNVFQLKCVVLGTFLLELRSTTMVIKYQWYIIVVKESIICAQELFLPFFTNERSCPLYKSATKCKGAGLRYVVIVRKAGNVHLVVLFPIKMIFLAMR